LNPCSATNPKPKQQKQPKTSPVKMQSQLFFYHTVFPRTNPSKHPTLQTNLPPSYAQKPSTSTLAQQKIAVKKTARYGFMSF
jgi:hypothetical protein